MATLTLAVGCSRNATPPQAGGTPVITPRQDASVTQIAPDLPPLPPGIVNAARPVAMAKAAYEFAARHPEVMQYVPCFCGCERGGHQGNHDCFVAGRDSGGRVTQWDAHGIGCQVCIDVGYQAMLLHSRGASVAEIRAAIDSQYASSPFRTPTPVPPAGGDQHHP